MTDFIEGNLLFEFDERWTPVLHWDRHDAYHKGIRRCEAGKAVDFIGVFDNKLPFLIEVKDFRIFERNRDKIPLPMEFERKVRDTVAALAGTHCHGRHGDCVQIFKTLMDTREPQLVLWHETTDTHSPTHKSNNGVLLDKIKAQLGWIRSAPHVTSRIYGGDIPGLKVTDLGPQRQHRLNELLTTIEARIEGRQFRRDERAIWKIQDTREIGRLDTYFTRIQTAKSLWQLLEG
jgi:hypothetical protein